MDQDMDRESGSMEQLPSRDELEAHDGKVEREVAFKLLAAHAMVDAEFYQRLHRDPAAAAAELHICLDEADIRYIQEVVKWDKLDKYADAVRQALQAEQAIRSPLW